MTFCNSVGVMAADGEVAHHVLEWLKNTKHVRVDILWLRACISWLKMDAANEYMNIVELKNEVYDQWLCTDLRESSTNYLPDDISTLAKYYTSGFLALQMNSIVNIGASAYSQMKKLKNEDTSTDENRGKPWQPKPCRMLKLELTDGKQVLEGMEYRPMKKLTTNLAPGTKILIKSNTLCRSGMLFLTDDNTDILGGKFKNLIEKNSQRKVLNELIMKAKGLSEDNDAPSTEAVSNVKKGIRIDTGTKGNNAHKRQFQSSVNCNQGNSPPQRQMEITKPNYDFDAFLNDDDDFLAELPLDGIDLAELSDSTGSPSTSTQQPRRRKIIVIDDDSADDEPNNIKSIENNFLQNASDDELIRNVDKTTYEEWQFDDDDDFE